MEMITSTLDQTSSDDVVVIAVPFAGSHLNQMLSLSCLIASYGLPVYYVSSAINIRQARLRVHALSPLDVAKIHFHELLGLSPLDSPPSDTNLSRFEPQLVPLLKSTIDMRKPFADYLHEMSGKYRKVVVVHDIATTATVQDIVSIPKAESYALMCGSAMFMASFFDQSVAADELKEQPSMSEILWYYMDEHIRASHQSGSIYNTCRAIEGPYLDILERQQGKKCWAVGPTAPIIIEPDARRQHKCLEWLDQHDVNSVIYVSFGTTVTLLNEEVKELAEGLETCNEKFLWVLRDCDKPNIFDGDPRRVELPEGFEERTKGVGIVVRDWAPQPDILAHPSVGGFLSHCGWNSCMESFSAGMPMAAWPMHSDQPLNSVIVTKILKVGLLVKEWDAKMETARASTIASVLKKLMATEEGEEIRMRARELGAKVRKATQPGGESGLELDSFIAHITR